MKAPGIYIVLLVALLVSFCAKQKYPESTVVNNTAYGFTAIINNKAVSIAAGVNNYYMYSSYQQGSDSIYNFSGALKEMGCTDCRNSLSVQINDYKVSQVNGPIVLDSLFFPHSFSFLSDPAFYLVTFQSSFNKPAASYRWDFGDGTFSNDASPSHYYSKPGNYGISLKITSSDGCESTIRQVKNIAVAPDNYLTDIDVTGISGNAVSFKNITTGGRQPYKYLWNFGDGQFSSSANPSHSYAVVGGHPVSLAVTDADNKTVIAEYNVVTQNDNSSCAANFQLPGVSRLQDYSSLLKLSRITINWTDENGTVYSSNNNRQPMDSQFKIMSVEDGGVNENNLPIKKLHVVFNCKAYHGSDVIDIKNAEAVIAVAYK